MFKSQKKLKKLLKLFAIGTVIIFFFTGIFYMFDHNHFDGIDEEDEEYKFINRLYFTITTFSSAGYGDITPKTMEVKGVSVVLQFILIISLMSGIINLFG